VLLIVYRFSQLILTLRLYLHDAIAETQEVIKPHPEFLLFATQNPPGIYGGRKVSMVALRRSSVFLRCLALIASLWLLWVTPLHCHVGVVSSLSQSVRRAAL